MEEKKINICILCSDKHHARGYCKKCYVRLINYTNPKYRIRKLQRMREYMFEKRLKENITHSFSYGLYLRKLLV